MVAWAWALPFALQGVALAADEALFHRRRVLPLWERVGHPLDALTIAACLAWVARVPYSGAGLKGYAAFAIFSCLFVTKDEWVHARLCPAGEHWLHAVQFMLHAAALTALGFVWAQRGQAPEGVGALAFAVPGIALVQAVAWNLGRGA